MESKPEKYNIFRSLICLEYYSWFWAARWESCVVGLHIKRSSFRIFSHDTLNWMKQFLIVLQSIQPSRKKTNENHPSLSKYYFAFLLLLLLVASKQLSCSSQLCSYARTHARMYAKLTHGNGSKTHGIQLAMGHWQPGWQEEVFKPHTSKVVNAHLWQTRLSLQLCRSRCELLTFCRDQ